MRHLRTEELEHVSGGQYGGLMFEWSVVPDQLGWYLSQLPGELAWVGLAVALVGLALVLLPSLYSVIAGLTLVGVGTFFAQAVATGHVGRIARGDKAAASGLYLSSYYCGGLAGAAVIGQLFDRLGWTAAGAGVFAALALAALLGSKLVRPEGA